MQLDKKRALAARVLGVGRERILFNMNRLNEIKDALTRADIRDLYTNKAIMIGEIKGTLKKEKRNNRRRAGSVKHKPNLGKRGYMMRTRKFREYISELRKHNTITDDIYLKLRKEIRASAFKSKGHIKERINHLLKEN